MPGGQMVLKTVQFELVFRDGLSGLDIYLTEENGYENAY